MKKNIIITIAVLTVALVGIVFAQMPDRWMEKMELTNVQQTEIKKIQNAWEEKQIDLGAAMQKAELSLRNLMDDPNSKSSEIIAAAKKVQSAKSDIELGRITMMANVRDQLTPAQRENFGKFMHKKGMMGGMGMGMGEGCGMGGGMGMGCGKGDMPGMMGGKGCGMSGGSGMNMPGMNMPGMGGGKGCGMGMPGMNMPGMGKAPAGDDDENEPEDK